jgi:tetratricopeptide (TPR) repeat protein
MQPGLTRFRTVLVTLALFVVFVLITGRAGNSASIPPTQRERELDSLFLAGDYHRLVELASKYANQAALTNDSLMQGRMLTALGRGEVMLGRTGGYRRLVISIRISRAVGDTTNWMTALGYQSLVLSNQGRLDACRRLSEQRLELARVTRDRISEAWARTMLGYVALLLGEFDDARTEYGAAVDIFSEMNARRELLTPLIGLGRVYGSLQDVENARECYRKALEISREVGDRENEVHAVNNLGTLEFDYGNMELAVQYYQRSLDMAAESGNMRGTVTPATNIALAMQYLGRYEDAGAELDRALALCQEKGYDDLIPMVLSAQGENAFLEGRYNTSQRVYRRLLDLGDALQKKEHDESVFGLARCLTLLGKPREALDVLNEGFASPPMPTLESAVLWAEADCLLDLGLPGDALENALAAEEAAASSGSELRGVATALKVSECYRKLGRLDEALNWFRVAVKRHAGRLSAESDPVWRESLGGTAILVDASGVILEQTGISLDRRKAELFDLFQQFKGRTLVDRITEPRRHDEPVSQLAAIEPIDLSSLQDDVLGADELFLDFAVGDDTGYLFAVTRDSCRVTAIPGRSSAFAERVSMYRHVLGQRPGPAGGAAADLGRMDVAMGRAILGGVGDLIRSSSTLVLSPVSFYGGIPFGALSISGDGGDTRSLISEKLIERTPSATILAWLRSQGEAGPPEGSAGPAVLAIEPAGGDALAGARREVASLKRAFAGVDVASGAKDAAFPDGAGPYEVIHVAAHVEVNDEKPWHSGILLGSGEEGDDFPSDPYLRAGEIASRRFPAKLAVLSGCESAMGRPSVGEGVAGLTAAFLSAGVHSVVATLWRVDDDVTAELMRHFYGGLADSMSVAAALRAAQLATRADPRTSHPFYWAGFVDIGDGGVSIRLDRRRGVGSRQLLLILLAGAALVAGIWIFLRHKRLH